MRASSAERQPRIGGVFNRTAPGRRPSVTGNARTPRALEALHLLQADPELGALLTPERRAEAERELLVRTHRIGVGPWDVTRLSSASADHVGLLVLDGVLSRELVVADQVSAELLGPGDLVRPWQGAKSAGLLPVAGRVVRALDGDPRRARPPLRGRGRPLPGGHGGAVRAARRALAAARHHAGHLPAHPRRPPAEGALLAPRRALGTGVRRRRRRPAARSRTASSGSWSAPAGRPCRPPSASWPSARS